MKKNYIHHLKSYLMLFVLSLCCSSAWAVDIPADCFYLEALTDGSTVKMVGDGGCTVSLEYITSGSANWQTFTVGETEVSLSAGQKVYIRDANSSVNGPTNRLSNSSAYNRFKLTGSIKAGGNIMYLLNKNAASDFTSQKNENAFSSLFMDQSALTDVKDLVLPATTMVKNCYASMFNGCTGITAAPLLPATTLAEGCYNYMFTGCSNLKSVTVAFSVWSNSHPYYTTNWLSNVAENGTFNALSSSLPLTRNSTNPQCFSDIPPSWTARTVSSDSFDWTITPGAPYLNNAQIRINVSPAVKLGDDVWTSTMTNDASKKTVTFMTNDIVEITTGELNNNNGVYYICVPTDNVAALMAYQGQQINIKFPAGAFTASPTAGSPFTYDMPSQVVEYTLPAKVDFSFSANPDLVKIDDQQALNGFDLIVTAGTEMPKVNASAKFYFTKQNDPNEYKVTFADQEPVLVAGTTNQWKFKGQLAMSRDPNTGIYYIVKNTEGLNTERTDKTTLNDGDYTLHIPAGAFSSGIYASEAEGTVNYNILPKAEITFTTHGVIRDVVESGDPTYSFYLDVQTSVTSGVGADPGSATFSQGWTVSNYQGSVQVTLDNNTGYGYYKITLDYSKLDLTQSSYVLTIPAGKFYAKNSYNEKTLLTFTIADRAKWTKAQGGSEPDYAVTVDESNGIATIVPTTNTPAQALTILKAGLIYLSYGSSRNNIVPATFEVVPGSSELKVMADFKKENAPYYVCFESGAIKAGNTIYTSGMMATTAFPVARINVTANGTFVDSSVEGATATTKDDVVADKVYDQLTYKRNYTGKTETLFVPFDIKPTEENQILDNVYIWKLVNITEENGQPVFNFTQVENDATIYANMPYLIRKKDGVAGEYAMTQQNVKTVAPASNSVESSTVTDTYTFTGIIEDTNLVGSTGKVWYVKKSTGNLNNLTDGQNGTLAAWRWYMTTTSNNINYAKIRLDGVEDDETTSIDQIENGTLYMVNGKCFNLNGQRLSKPQRGSINIINGKKVFVK